MPQITDTELLNKAVEEIAEKYNVPPPQIREAISTHNQEIRHDLNPRESLEWAIFKLDKEYRTEAESMQQQEKQSQGYKIG